MDLKQNNGISQVEISHCLRLKGHFLLSNFILKLRLNHPNKIEAKMLYQFFMKLHRIRSPLAPLIKGGTGKTSIKVPLFKGDLGG